MAIKWKHERYLLGDGIVLYLDSEGGTLVCTCDNLIYNYVHSLYQCQSPGFDTAHSYIKYYHWAKLGDGYIGLLYYVSNFLIFITK